MPKLRNRIPKLLEQREMTIGALQIAAKLDWVTTHKIVREEFIPDRTTVKTLYSIARALGVGIDDLFEDMEL